MTILVTGATGTVGRWVVDHLIAAGHEVRAMSRNPAAAALPDGVEVVAGTMTDTDSLAAAMEGATAAHLIAFGDGYAPLDNGEQIAKTLQQAGVERCTVLFNWDDTTLQPALEAARFPWTHLAPGEFMSNKIEDWGEAIRHDGVVREVGVSPSPLIHPSDIGAVAAHALTEPGHTGHEYALTGPEALTPADQVQIIAEAIGRDLRFEQLTPEEGAAFWLTQGLTEDMIEFKLFLADDANLPPDARDVWPTVSRVTGRPALRFEQWARENASSFLD
ncbi:SDR family oxidoreductase [Nocardiopsis nanhaiensis]